jgi:hypothetical protein
MLLNNCPIVPAETTMAVAAIIGASALAGYERRRWAAHETAQDEKRQGERKEGAR